MSTRIDFHSHIIPGADHGCATAKEAAQQLVMMKNAGIGTVVATPHFYPEQHSVEDFLTRVNVGVEELMRQASADAPTLFLGAEVLLCPNLHQMPGFDKLCIRGTRTILLELPFIGCTQSMVETVEDMIALGYTVVLAHIDRYLKHDSDTIDHLLNMGAWAQINASSMKGLFNRRRLMPYLGAGDVVAFGSDLHGLDRKAVQDFASLYSLPNGLFDQVCQKSESLLQGAEKIQ